MEGGMGFWKKLIETDGLGRWNFGYNIGRNEQNKQTDANCAYIKKCNVQEIDVDGNNFTIILFGIGECEYLKLFLN